MNLPDDNLIEQLVFDKSFRDWVIFKDQTAEQIWREYLRDNPKQTEAVNYAKAILYALQIERNNLTSDEVDREVEKILLKTKNET